jgi:hypothetical protein
MVEPAHRGQHHLQEYPVNKFILTAAVAAAIGMPAVAGAQTAAAPYVCHAPSASETSNATMGSTKLYCKAVDMAQVMKAEKSLMSMMPKTMTDAQSKQMKADQDTISTAFMLPKIPGGGGQSDR